jgi:hypothetical protein
MPEHRRLHARHLLFQDHLLADRAAAAADLARPIEPDPALSVEVLGSTLKSDGEVVHAPLRRPCRPGPERFGQVILDERRAPSARNGFLFLAVAEVHRRSALPLLQAVITRS